MSNDTNVIAAADLPIPQLALLICAEMNKVKDKDPDNKNAFVWDVFARLGLSEDWVEDNLTTEDASCFGFDDRHNDIIDLMDGGSRGSVVQFLGGRWQVR